jgi:hypothetical protein
MPVSLFETPAACPYGHHLQPGRMIRGWQPCVCPDAGRGGGHFWLKCLNCSPARRTFYWVPDCRDQIRSDAQVWETDAGMWISLPT